MITKLGIRVEDVIITGFVGLVVGRVEYISGCHQALVVPRVKDDGSSVEGQWFDEQRLKQLGSDIVALDNGATPGCDRAAPKR